MRLTGINDLIRICNSIGCKFKRSELDTSPISLWDGGWGMRDDACHHMGGEAK